MISLKDKRNFRLPILVHEITNALDCKYFMKGSPSLVKIIFLCILIVSHLLGNTLVLKSLLLIPRQKQLHKNFHSSCCPRTWLKSLTDQILSSDQNAEREAEFIDQCAVRYYGFSPSNSIPELGFSKTVPLPRQVR